MRAAVSAVAGNSLCSGWTGLLKEAVVLRQHRVNAGVNVDHHIRPRREIPPSAMGDPSLGDANEVVQATVGFVIGLEPADKVLPSRLIAVKDRSHAKLEEDRCAILGGDQACQHPGKKS
jgi:hypothetical protein